MHTFNDFGLPAPILAALAGKGYSAPTPIQLQSISPILAGRDLCGIAQTGTGKTAAFALPILTLLAKSAAPRTPRAPRALVLAPTRELASQIDQEFRAYGSGLQMRTAVIFGGVSQRPQTEALNRGVDILVATPGRLLDLVEQRALSLSKVEILVLDEADQMLDLGFIVPLKRIVRLVPAKRQTLFFSATMPRSIADFAGTLLNDPVQVAVAPVATTAERVEQSVIYASAAQKQPLLEAVLGDPAMQRVLVFTRTKHGADKVVKNLDRAGIGAAAIHGNKSQNARERALAGFKGGNVRVLVATDIAARGIHVNDVTHVVNFDLPNVAESYVHRIGRTARAGAAGIAISFCSGEERGYLRDIEKLTRMQLPIAAAPQGVAATMEPETAPMEQRRGGRSQPRSPSAKRGHSHGGRAAQPHSGHRQASGQRNEHRSQGVDPTTGLPGFISQRQRRGADARH